MLALLFVLACGGTEAAKQTVDNAVHEAAGEAGGASTHAAALQKADAHDGTEDHVVSECAGCGLNMDGDPDHAVKHEGYELHFCSDSCQQRFEEDPGAMLEKLN